MYELNRARLVGIGPRGARYSDVTLDLSGLGELLPQPTLFDTPIRRPSPFSLLLLENGGGKSVLLKLLFSVVLPGRRNTVGGASLDKFVLDGDTGHVALEWMHVTTGDRLVTAKVYQRRTRSGDRYPIAEGWYSFRPSDTLDLDNLPVTVDGRRRRLDGFREAVEEANRLEATTELAWHGDDQGRWRRHLRDRGIEPDLFDIQRRMNVDEGEAAKAFKYASSKEFVDWLLTTVTDPEDASSVALTFSKWAANLAEREQMLLERDFLEGVIAGLDPLAAAYAAHQAAARDAAAAVRGAETLVIGLDQRLKEERETVSRLGQEHQATQAHVVARSTERDAARALLNEVKRQTLQLELDEAEARKEKTQKQLAAAELEMYGWETITRIEARDQAVEASVQLAAQVAAADEDAAPALARRDETAGRLLAKYHAEAKASDDEATDHDAHVAAAKEAARAADLERSQALGQEATAREQHRAAQATVATATDRLVVAAGEELVPVGTTPSQVPGLAQAARILHQEAEGRLAERKRAADNAAQRCRAADHAVTAADNVLRTATTADDAASGNLRATLDEATRLTSMTALIEAVGADLAAPGADAEAPSAATFTVDALDEAADRLLEQLARDIEDHTDHLDELRAIQKEDARVVEALGTGGLLPPRPEVQQALEVLDAAGVVAHSGWRYLHEAVPATERTDLLAAHPALADGVVLVDAGQMPAARQALTGARLMPAAAVAVGSGAALLAIDPGEVGGDGAGNLFVVEPTPALYDEDCAAERREELREQMNRRGKQLLAGAGQLAAVTDARADLGRWRHSNPPGHLPKLRETAASARARLEAARKQLEASRNDLETATEDRKHADAEVQQATAKERHGADRATKLENLAALVESAAQAQQLLPEHEAKVRKHADAAERALGRRQRAEQDQSEHTRLGEQARAQAERHRAACADVPSTNGQPAGLVPDETLAKLRSAASAAHEIYLAAAVDQDLRRQADDAAAKVKTVGAELALRDPAHVVEAERLRATPAGADRASWSVGASNARRTAATLREEVNRLAPLAGQLRQAVADASPTEPGRKSWINLSERWQPTNPEHGRALQVEAQHQSRQAQIRLDDATGAVAEIDKQRRTADDAARGVNEALLPLAALLGGVPDGVTASSYAENVSTAQKASDAAVDNLRQTRQQAERSRNELAVTVQDLVAYANLSRYESLATQARRSILESGPDRLAARAEDWSAALQARLSTLTADLENANRHRKNIVDRLGALVEQAVKTLRRAARLSRLPDDLDEWGGRPFLRIAFSEPDRTAISVRVGEVVDRVAGEYAARAVGGKARNARRDGLALLLDAIHASVPKGFTVDVLKPDSVLRDERVSIEEMSDVFSGGQELTAAIVLYCTLAALSANERGQMRSRHSGVLFLDNPIGRANASYLIDLQKSVARSLGVQLVYTTGISDDRVLAAFPLWVRLRNDADLRAGLKHIQVAEVVRRQLPAPYSVDEFSNSTDGGPGGAEDQSAPGTVTATRVHRRPAEHSTEPNGVRHDARGTGTR
ncbi:hypothetical protein SFC79_11330 [Nocardioides sp. S-58]|uniref:Chromosome segregation ATPase n=1 Tax=Nocardioides renjunii TaxID=3095075 RepID=A0ABU5KBQ9_9ACTN|nr:hypothetical protein [Nocardioides sp. S-58]MDZ5662357.1 hypothetical protein [Nocardioides sp. S-58]